MNRLQNILLGAWGLLILLFALFNWELLWREETITLLFMEFQWPWLFWFGLAALVMPALFRWFAWRETRRGEKRTAREIAALKAKAFDQRDGELESLAQRIQDKLESSLKALIAEHGAGEATGVAEDKAEGRGKAKGKGQ